MSELKVDTVVNLAGTGKPNFENGVTINGAATSTLNLNEYTESSSEPSSPSNGALWWDTANEKTFIYAEGEWKETIGIAASISWGGDRGVTAHGNGTNTMSYFDITSSGNATDFGDLGNGTDKDLSSSSNSSRGLFAGFGTNDAEIEYITTSTTGNATDFGNFSGSDKSYSAGVGDGTYGVFGGGYVFASNGQNNNIDRVTIATTGNGTDFGDLSDGGFQCASGNDATRGLFAGGIRSSNPSDVIDYITMATASNATDFGNTSVTRKWYSGFGDLTRSCFGGGLLQSGSSNVIDYVTTQTTGNATDFGDLSQNIWGITATCNTTTGIFAGGSGSVAFLNEIQKITIQTTGNASDHGDLTGQSYSGASTSGAAS